MITKGDRRDPSAPVRTPRCRMLDSKLNRCPNPALDPLAKVLICAKHAARVLELVRYHRNERRAS